MKLFAKLTLISTALIDTSAFAVDVENRSLDELYQAAVKEGGTLVVYADGDTAEQQNGIKAAFEKRFPKIAVGF